MTSRRTIIASLAAALVLAACGGSDDGDSTALPPEPDFTITASGARWLGAGLDDRTDSLDEFDITTLKTDPDVVGVEAWWELEAADDGFDTISAEVDVRIDGQARSLGFIRPPVRGSTERVVEEGPIRIEPIDGGVRVSYRFEPDGASDLYDENGDPVVLRNTTMTMDFEEGSADLDVSYVNDLDEIGVLDYQVALTVDGERLPGAEVMFSAVESDPDAVAVDDNASAESAVDVADTEAGQEVAGCVASTVTVTDTTATIVSAVDGSTFEFTAPADWTVASEPSTDPCLPADLDIASPPASPREDIEFVMAMEDPFGDSIDTLADEWMAFINTGYDDDGNEIALEPGDD